jgi:hypothetical protein
LGMQSERQESASEWAERALVADALAAAQEEALAEAGNPTAKRVARLRAEEASADLKQALDALQAQRQRSGT